MRGGDRAALHEHQSGLLHDVREYAVHAVSADALCPECHGVPDLRLVFQDRLVKCCRDCGHEWNESRDTPSVLRKGGWIYRDATITKETFTC